MARALSEARKDVQWLNAKAGQVARLVAQEGASRKYSRNLIWFVVLFIIGIALESANELRTWFRSKIRGAGDALRADQDGRGPQAGSAPAEAGEADPQPAAETEAIAENPR